jgi:hypothetical protein
MSHIIPHGVFTTRKLTGNPWPPDWYLENPMFPYLHQWADFARWKKKGPLESGPF